MFLNSLAPDPFETQRKERHTKAVGPGAPVSQGTLDFGQVDWGAIWRDRASLVSAEHLAQLNAISPAMHLNHPGYWRNIFADFKEVIRNAETIVRVYTKKGETPKFKVVVPPPPSQAYPESPKSEKRDKLIEAGLPMFIAEPTADVAQKLENAALQGKQTGEGLLAVGLVVAAIWAYGQLK